MQGVGTASGTLEQYALSSAQSFGIQLRALAFLLRYWTFPLRKSAVQMASVSPVPSLNESLVRGICG